MAEHAESSGGREPFTEHVQKLLTAGEGRCLTIDGPGDELIQVADEGSSVTLTVQLGHYPYSQPPEEALAGSGVKIPTSWELIEWEADAFASYAATRGRVEDMVVFLQEVVEKFYGIKSSEEISFSLEEF